MQPSSDAWTPRDLIAGLKERDRRIMIDGFGRHRANDRHIIDILGSVREQLADPSSIAAVLSKFEDRSG